MTILIASEFLILLALQSVVAVWVCAVSPTTVLGFTLGARAWEPPCPCWDCGSGAALTPRGAAWVKAGAQREDERLGLVPLALAAAAPCPAGCPRARRAVPPHGRLARLCWGARRGLLLGASPSPQPPAEEYDADRILSLSPPPSINNSGWADLSDSPGRADPLTRAACSGKSECKTYRSKNRAAGEPRRQVPAASVPHRARLPLSPGRSRQLWELPPLLNLRTL